MNIDKTLLAKRFTTQGNNLRHITDIISALIPALFIDIYLWNHQTIHMGCLHDAKATTGVAKSSCVTEEKQSLEET